MLAEIDTNKRNVLHDDLLRKEYTLLLYRLQGGGDHLLTLGKLLIMQPLRMLSHHIDRPSRTPDTS
ncbi:hypothetical protein CE665_24900 [Salmonella enterica subsp. enterica serovar Poona]|nr:hypothetical protein [Salmonella enterica subsp. enterica serovar Poona]